MKIRILEDVKTNLTEEDILLTLPEEVDLIGISEMKVKNYLVRYFLHKNEIVVTEVKPLPEEVETNSNHKNVFLAFLKEESSLLSVVDLYSLYKTYRDKSFAAYVDGNNKDYLKYKSQALVNNHILLATKGMYYIDLYKFLNFRKLQKQKLLIVEKLKFYF